jgi:hypothetical protein
MQDSMWPSTQIMREGNNSYSEEGLVFLFKDESRERFLEQS